MKSQSLVISEISENSVEILNQSEESIDISDFWLCNRPDYIMIGNLATSCGDLVIAAGGLVTVDLNFTLEGAGDELGLFTNNSFGDPNAIIDYVIWGDRSGFTRESTAVSGGIWTAGERATSFGMGEQLVYDGSGDAPEDYFQGSSSTPCVDCPVREGDLLANDAVAVSICIDSASPDLVELTVSSNAVGQSLFLTTDTNDIILSIDTSSVLSFDSAAPAVCLIRQVSFMDTLAGAQVGGSLERLSGCFLFSNTVTINKLRGDACQGEEAPLCEAMGGDIFLADSTTAITFCVEDAIPDIVPVTLVGASGSNSAWVITDSSLVILDIDTTNNIDFTGLGDGNCLIWHLSFEDDLTGAVIGASAADLTGCFDLSNSIAVTRLAVCDTMPETCQDVSVAFDVSICPGESFDFNGEIITESGVFVDTLMKMDGCDSIVMASVTLLEVPTSSIAQSICEGDSFTFMDSVITLPGDYVFTVDLPMGCDSMITLTLDFLPADQCMIDCLADGGQITLSDSTTSTAICVDDDLEEPITVTLANATGANSAWVLTDTSLTILDIDSSNIFSLDESDAGVCLIWHLSFEDGLSGAELGANAADLMGCFDLSNAIEVVKEAGCGTPPPSCDVVASTITTIDGETMTSVCVDDEEEELIQIQVSGGMGSQEAIVLTDEDLNILMIETNTTVFSLESRGEGRCLLWHVQHDGTLSGAEVGANADDLTGCFALSNPVTVDRLSGDACIGGGSGMNMDTCTVVAAAILTQNDTDQISLCTDDDNEELVLISSSGGQGSNSAFVVTDTALNILFIESNTAVFSLEAQPFDICLIWQINFEDDLTGANIGGNAANLGGCFALSNPITVTKLSGDACNTEPVCEVSGGEIILADSTSSTSICVVDDIADMQSVTLLNASGTNSAWLTTDTSGLILTIDTTNIFEFDSSDAGVCLIWHLSFEEGLVGAEVGQNANDLEGCFDLSNPIVVTKEVGCGPPPPPTCEVSGGEILLADSTSSTSICVVDNIADMLTVTLLNASGTNSAWVTTDTSGLILTIDTTNIFEFDSSDAGVCLIWHLSFEEGLVGAEVGQNANDLEGCFDLSNPIAVTKEVGCGPPPPPTCEVSGGEVMLSDSTTSTSICVVDEAVDTITVTLLNAIGSNSVWVTTDTNAVILSIDTTNTFVFGNSEPGVCLIWHLSFEEGLVGAEVGQNANDIEGCFDLSNSIQVTKEDGCGSPPPPCLAIGGTIVSQNGTDQISICADDDIEETVVVTASGAEGVNTAFIVTDTAQNILVIEENTNVFSLESLGGTSLSVWLISSDESLVGLEVGSNVNDLTGCFSLSNPISVTLLSGDDCPVECSVDGGEIVLGEEATSTTVCVDDNIEEPVTPTLLNASGSNSLWIITDTSLSIVSIDTNNTFIFENTGPGTSLIWHVSFEDGATGIEIGANAAAIEGCFDLSNAITIVRETQCGGSVCTAAGGTLTSIMGESTVTVCGGDGVATPVDVELTGAVGDNSTWVITDTSGVIIGFPLAPPFNLGGTRVGVLQIWSLSFEGAIQGASLGANISDITGCLAFSNPLIVNRVDIEASTIAFADSVEVMDICISGSEEVNVDVTITGSEGLTSWIIADPNGNILFIGDNLNEGITLTGSGTTTVQLANHATDFSAEVGSTVADISGCFALSNGLMLNANRVSGGSLFTEIGTDELTFCIDDDIEDDIDLTLTGASGASSLFIVTDTSGIVLATSEDLDISLEELGSGVCLLWHVSSDMTLDVEVGTSVSDLSGCVSFSNPVTINKEEGDNCPPACSAIGGMILTLDGDDNITICVDDDLSDFFELQSIGAEGDSTAFIVTDVAGNVLGINPTFEADLEGTGPGTTLVRFIAYNAGTMIPENGGRINELTGCFALSNTFTINRVVGPDCSAECIADGGILSLVDDASDSFCTDDGEADIVDLLVVNSLGQNNAFLFITDDRVITEIVGDGEINLEGTGDGSLQITHLVYSDSISNLEIGASLSDLAGCFDLSNTIEVFRRTDTECPGVCATDGGMIFTESGDTELEFCAGDVLFTVDHESTADTLTTTYFYVVTDEDGEITEFRPAVEGGDFNLNTSPGGICRVYGYSTDDPESISTGIPVEVLEEGCGDLSTNFITIDKQTGGACDEGCHAPRDVRVESLGRNRWTVRWDRVVEAQGFTIRVGFEGLPNSFSEVPVRRNRINLTGPPGRVLVIQIRSECGFGEVSPFTGEIRLVEEATGTSASIGRSFDIQHGTVLANGVVITEQALVFPNPAVDEITVWFESEGTSSQLSLFNKIGQRVYTQRLNDQLDWHNLSVADLPAGIYMMIIENDGVPLHRDKLMIADR